MSKIKIVLASDDSVELVAPSGESVVAKLLYSDTELGIFGADKNGDAVNNPALSLRYNGGNGINFSRGDGPSSAFILDGDNRIAKVGL